MPQLTEALLETLRQALEPDASADVRAAGADACRTLLTVLDAGEGKALAAAPVPSTPVAAMAQQFAAAPPGAVLDAVIARLRALVPDDAPEPAAAPAPAPLRIPFVPIPTPKGQDK